MFRKPICPDPDLFVWVQTSDGKGYWRRKRGTIKPARLNASLQRNALLSGIMNEAASRIKAKLYLNLDKLQTGRFFSGLCGKLIKAYNARGSLNYSTLAGLNVQPRHPLEKLVPLYMVIQRPDMVEVQIAVDGGNLKIRSQLISHYFFELILLEGDAGIENDLNITSDMSAVYEAGKTAPDCILRVRPAKEPWMVLLKVSCIETPTANTLEMAVSASNYGMKVVRTS